MVLTFFSFYDNLDPQSTDKLSLFIPDLLLIVTHNLVCCQNKCLTKNIKFCLFKTISSVNVHSYVN